MYKILTYETGGVFLINNAIDTSLLINNHKLFFKAYKKEFSEFFIPTKNALISMPRKILYFGDKDYSYSGITHSKKPFDPLLIELKEKIIEHPSIRKYYSSFISHFKNLNSCLINLYENETSSVSYHSDDEKELGPDNNKNIIVCSISFGDTRDFMIRSKDKTFEIKVEVKDSDLLVMYGDFQSKFEHAVPKSKTRKNERINFTFRIIN